MHWFVGSYPGSLPCLFGRSHWAAQESPGAVTGKVVDNSTQQPLASVEVALAGDSVPRAEPAATAACAERRSRGDLPPAGEPNWVRLAVPGNHGHPGGTTTAQSRSRRGRDLRAVVVTGTAPSGARHHRLGLIGERRRGERRRGEPTWTR